jgi:hypothetical protein
MILSIEDNDEMNSKKIYLQRSRSSASIERVHSYESDV